VKRPEFQTIQDNIQYHVSVYYVARERHPNISSNLERHINLFLKVEKDFHKHLSRYYPEWDNEENRGKLREQVDFLTQIFTRQKKEQENKARLAEMRSKLKKR
jgi:hypothetical protein